MNVSPDVNFEELSRTTDDFNGAQCKAVCVEAVSVCMVHIDCYHLSLWSLLVNCICFQGMIALRRNASVVTHEDFMDAILEVQAKKKANLNYYA